MTLSDSPAQVSTSSEAQRSFHLESPLPSPEIAPSSYSRPRSSSNPTSFPSPKAGRSWLRRLTWFVAVVAVVGGVGWYGAKSKYFAPKLDQIITSTVARGDLVITVTERGELESSQALQVNCDIEGGGKLVTIIPEGTRVTKGQEVARFDVDILSKNINAQEVKCGQAEG